VYRDAGFAGGSVANYDDNDGLGLDEISMCIEKV
jgi:hypothetical protein